MKKFIRWLADVSGVTKDIEIETCEHVGHQMHDYSYWFNHFPMANYVLVLYSEHLRNGFLNLYGNELDKTRSKIAEFKKTINQIL